MAFVLERFFVVVVALAGVHVTLAIPNVVHVVVVWSLQNKKVYNPFGVCRSSRSPLVFSALCLLLCLAFVLERFFVFSCACRCSSCACRS